MLASTTYHKIFLREKNYGRKTLKVFLVPNLKGQSLSLILNEMLFDLKHISSKCLKSLPFLSYLEKKFEGPTP